jgi:hypothetical protein
MKKFLVVLIVAFSLQTQAQIQFGFTGGVNYNSAGDFAELKTSGEDILSGAEGKTGYHAGIYIQIGKDFYVRPEAVYTQIKSGYSWNTTDVAAITTSKIDVPVLVGTKIVGPVTLFGGPSFQYITNVSLQDIDYSQLTYDDFSIGPQFGVGLQFESFGIDARYERSLNTNEVTFINNNNVANPTYINSHIDNRANQLIFSINFKF